MSLGVVARADQSGLAQLTAQVVDRLNPDRVLVVDLGHLNRGDYDPYRYDADGRLCFRQQHPHGWSVATLAGFLGGLTDVWTAETFYSPVLPRTAQEYGVRRHLYAMPELFSPRRPDCTADKVWLPCPLGPRDNRRIAGTVLPWWTPDVEPHLNTVHDRVRFVHPTGTAMADRNGTKELLAACAHVDIECDVIIVGNQQPFGDQCHVGPVRVYRIPRVDHWSDLYDLGDVLVLPRRYGWLSLPMFEAAAFGMPVITTDVWPQSDWFAHSPDLLVRTVGPPSAVSMKGGSILVHTAHPQVPSSLALQSLSSPPLLMPGTPIRPCDNPSRTMLPVVLPAGLR